MLIMQNITEKGNTKNNIYLFFKFISACLDFFGGRGGCFEEKMKIEKRTNIFPEISLVFFFSQACTSLIWYTFVQYTDIGWLSNKLFLFTFTGSTYKLIWLVNNLWPNQLCLKLIYKPFLLRTYPHDTAFVSFPSHR